MELYINARTLLGKLNSTRLWSLGCSNVLLLSEDRFHTLVLTAAFNGKKMDTSRLKEGGRFVLEWHQTYEERRSKAINSAGFSCNYIRPLRFCIQPHAKNRITKRGKVCVLSFRLMCLCLCF